MSSSVVNKKQNKGRDLVVVSGYYGFGNLGDEAILEELTDELKQFVPPDRIVVLSNDCAATENAFAVKAVNRWRIKEILPMMARARLFISGGGGLFQETANLRSCIYYGAQIAMARAMGAKVMVYAQGLGPLKTASGRLLTRLSMSLAHVVTVRDSTSFELLRTWNIEAQLTADPVWALSGKPLPKKVQSELSDIRERVPGLLAALSLRSSANFSPANLTSLCQALHDALPADASVLLLPLQNDQDAELLTQFAHLWKARGRTVETLATSELSLPSQWMTLISQVDLMVGMRLHALIMALRCGVPVAAIAYDPKVLYVAREFGQPILILTNDSALEAGSKSWFEALRTGIESRFNLSNHALEKAQAAKNLACQNINLLAKILGMQSDLEGLH